MKRPKDARESHTQTGIITYLQCLENQGKLYFVRNNSFAGRIQRRDRSFGWINNSKPGTPDIVMCYNGRFIGIEIKSDIGKLSKAQKEAKSKIERVGGLYWIVRGIEDLKQEIERLETEN